MCLLASCLQKCARPTVASLLGGPQRGAGVCGEEDSPQEHHGSSPLNVFIPPTQALAPAVCEVPGAHDALPAAASPTGAPSRGEACHPASRSWARPPQARRLPETSLHVWGASSPSPRRGVSVHLRTRNLPGLPHDPPKAGGPRAPWR